MRQDAPGSTLPLRTATVALKSKALQNAFYAGIRPLFSLAMGFYPEAEGPITDNELKIGHLFCSRFALSACRGMRFQVID